MLLLDKKLCFVLTRRSFLRGDARWQVLGFPALLASLSWLLVMPECVWLKAHAGVTGNALLMGAAIRQPSSPSRRKTRKKHAACQRLIRERSSVYNTAERNSKSLCSPRALSGGSPACWMHWSSFYTQHWLCVCVWVCEYSTAAAAEASFLSVFMFSGL